MLPILDRTVEAVLNPWPKNWASLSVAWLALFGGISFGQSDSVVVFNEIHYHPEAGEEWVELYNQMAVNIDLSGWKIEDGIDFAFPEGTVIPGGGYLVIQGEGGSLPGAIGPFEGRLNNAGETLRLVSRSERLMNEVNYGDGGDWPVAPDGSGATLAKAYSDSAAPIAENWTWSLQVGGTPGEINFANDQVPERALVINEMVGGGTDSFSIELFNRGTEAIELEGAVLADVTESEYVLGDITLEPGAFHLLTGTELGFAVAADDLMILFAADRTEILDVVRLQSGVRGRYPDGSDEWMYPALATPGAANEVDLIDSVVINEIHYQHPPQYDQEGIYGETETTPLSASWRYFQGGGLDAGWAEVSHPEWETGNGAFGFGLSGTSLPAPIQTSLNPGQITYYFETEFDFGADENAVEVQLQALVDDGAIFYINGVEFQRINMPEGEIRGSSVAMSRVDDYSFLPTITIPEELVKAGINLLSVEVHQNSFLSEDVLFGMEIALPEVIEPNVPFAEREEEWIELYNRSDAALDLSNWSFEDEAEFTFPAGTVLEAGGYLVVANDAASLEETYPEAPIIGDFSGRLSNSGGRIRLLDPMGNPADVVHYQDNGRWPEAADGGGASLELKDPDADNSVGEAWAASDTLLHTEWREYRMRGTAAPSTVGPDAQWREFVFGLLDDGVILIDDISVIEDPDGEARELIPNSGFQTSIFGGAPLRDWRLIGTHQYGEAVPDPDNAANTVLKVVSTGQTEHMHNHISTNLANGRSITNGQEYEISFRARHVSGSPRLHTRLYFNRLAKSWLIKTADIVGTPGDANTRLVANIGPTYQNLRHDPAVPSPSESVHVSVTASDPQGIAALTLRWAADGSGFADVEMTDAGDGEWQGSIPPQAAGTVVQFYVEAEDQEGAISNFPVGGVESRALYQVNDGRATTGPLNNFRIIMKEEDADWLHNEINLMSSGRIPGTVIYREREIHYDVGIRLKGSQRGRVTQPRLGFNVWFPNEHLFRGTHSSVALDRSEGVNFGQREILINQMMTAAGAVPAEYNDLAYVVPPRATYTGPVELQLGRYNNLFLDSQFENGSDGFLYEYELVYYPTTVNAEGYKRPQPDQVVGIQIRDLGDSEENYRWSFLAKNQNERDEFRPVVRYMKMFSLQGDAFFQELDAIVDVEQWLRNMAFASLSGAGDQYAANSGHNGMFYQRPDGKMLYFVHDLDFAFEAGRSITENTELRRIIANPVYHRLYLAYLNDIIDTSHNSSYLSPWADHFGELLPGQNFESHLNFMVSRTNSVSSQIRQAAPAVTFQITTNDGDDFETDEQSVEIEGDGWINVHSIRIGATGMELEPEWIDFDSWRIQVPLEPGENVLALQALDFQGTVGSIFAPVGNDSITVTYTGQVQPATSENLIISELMYNPVASTDTESAAGFDDNNAFEFIELLNIGASTIDLTGLIFDRGIEFGFAPETRLSAGARLLIVRDRNAFEFRYGNALPIVAEWGESRLSNDGERLTLSRGGGEVIFYMTFGVDAPWPTAAAGNGASLILLGATAKPDVNEATNWRASSVIGGSPGEGDEEVPSESYTDWQEAHFTEEERADDSISGLNADPDGDALANGLEFAFGTDPRASGGGPRLELTVGDTLSLIYIRRRDSGLSFLVETSPDLETWTQENWEPSGNPEPVGDDQEQVVLHPADEAPVGEGYLRLRVEGF